MIIIEGTDLLGKTTFAKKLVAAAPLVDKGYIYKHFSRLPDGFNRYWGYLEHAASRSVQDRFHMSEIAYCYARGEDSSRLSPWAYKMVDGYLRCMCAYTVVFTAEDDLIRERYGEREEMYDLGIILRANSVFLEITDDQSFAYNDERYSGIDVDACIHLTKENPWPSEQDLRNVLNAYQRRSAEWELAMRLRPISSPLQRPLS
jgi:thymidylate kinase